MPSFLRGKNGYTGNRRDRKKRKIYSEQVLPMNIEVMTYYIKVNNNNITSNFLFIVEFLKGKIIRITISRKEPRLLGKYDVEVY